MKTLLHNKYLAHLTSLTLFVLLALLFLPSNVSAELFGFDFIVCGKETPDCTIKHIFILADMMVKFFLYLSVPLTIILITWVGIKYLTAGGDQKNLADAKSMLKHVALGLAFILGAYLVVHTIFEYFVKDNFRMFGI